MLSTMWYLRLQANRCPFFQFTTIHSTPSSMAIDFISPTPWPPQANVATNAPNITTPSSWLLDSGVSHHIIIDLWHLSLHSPYSGSNDISIGDGMGLPITSSTTLMSLTTTFTLNNVFYIPNMTKNLISISQFFSY